MSVTYKDEEHAELPATLNGRVIETVGEWPDGTPFEDPMRYIISVSGVTTAVQLHAEGGYIKAMYKKLLPYKAKFIRTIIKLNDDRFEGKTYKASKIIPQIDRWAERTSQLSEHDKRLVPQQIKDLVIAHAIKEAFELNGLIAERVSDDIN